MALRKIELLLRSGCLVTVIAPELREELRELSRCTEQVADMIDSLMLPEEDDDEFETKLKALPGVSETDVQVVLEPAWDQSRMSDAARLQLGLM